MVLHFIRECSGALTKTYAIGMQFSFLGPLLLREALPPDQLNRFSSLTVHGVQPVGPQSLNNHISCEFFFVYHCASEGWFKTSRVSHQVDDRGRWRFSITSSWGKRSEEQHLTALNSEPEGVLQYRKPKKLHGLDLWIQGVDLHAWPIF